LSINLAFADNLVFDPAIKTGTLDNGLKYYILKNEQTKNNAYFYLNVQAGSIDETDEEQGLAHFVEHMAFNGSTHFKKNELIRKLEQLGVRFGADLNASTSFQNTTYNLQINTAEKENINSAFLVLSDWAGGISFDAEEIEKEKGVVLEEAKKDVGRRFYEKRATYLYPNSIFAKRFPIGKNEIIANTDQKTVKGFYQRMYRPDLMSVIVVGDIDEKEIEQKIKQHFNNLKVSGSLKRADKTLQPFEKGFANLVEKEGGSAFIQVLFAEPYKNVDSDTDVRNILVRQYISSLLHLGFQKLNQELKSPQEVFYSNQNLFQQRNLNAFSIDIVDKQNEQSLGKIFSTIKGVRKYGFSNDDFVTVKKVLLQANQTDSLREESQEKQLGDILSYIKSGNIRQDKKQKHALIERYLNEISLNEVNDAFKKITNGDYFVEIISQEPIELTQKQIDKINKKSKAYNFSKDFQAAASLMDKIPAKQAIVSDIILPDNDIHKIVLANGVVVYLKDIKTTKNKINLLGIKKGGLTNLPDVQQAKMVNALLNAGNIGKFEKYEAQKITKQYSYGLSISVNQISTSFKGQSSKDDLEKMLQELFVRFTHPVLSQTEWEIYQKEMKSDIEKRNQTVDYRFGKEFSEIFY
ncbi:MAG: insulinase family protein, partial [Neisseriaceae bacterium]|nr:insulinase family protein [Neisseriaceae bacterium]